MKIPLNVEIDLDPGDELSLRFEPSHPEFKENREIPATLVLSLKRDGVGTYRQAIAPAMIEQSANSAEVMAAAIRDARFELVAQASAEREAERLTHGEGDREPKGILHDARFRVVDGEMTAETDPIEGVEQ